jgi:hypothetical protein
MTDSINVTFVGINREGFLASQNFGADPKILNEKRQVTNSESVEPDLLICVDADGSSLRQASKLKKTGVKTVLVASEPSVVIPENYSKRRCAVFEGIVEVGRPNCNPLLAWPQNPFSEPYSGPKANSGNAILIQSRKYSFVKGQLYGLRVQLAARDKRVSVVGHSWDEPWYRTIGRLLIELSRAVRAGAALDLSTLITGFQKPINLLGPAESKNEAMRAFTAAVVIENSQEYMSEKLFDAFVGGSIPVYVGADLEPFGIPSDLYVKSEASLESLQRGITEALAMDYELWQSRVQSFLSDEKTIQTWEYSRAHKTILNAAINQFDDPHQSKSGIA